MTLRHVIFFIVCFCGVFFTVFAIVLMLDRVFNNKEKTYFYLFFRFYPIISLYNAYARIGYLEPINKNRKRRCVIGKKVFEELEEGLFIHKVDVNTFIWHGIKHLKPEVVETLEDFVDAYDENIYSTLEQKLNQYLSCEVTNSLTEEIFDLLFEIQIIEVIDECIQLYYLES